MTDDRADMSRSVSPFKKASICCSMRSSSSTSAWRAIDNWTMSRLTAAAASSLTSIPIELPEIFQLLSELVRVSIDAGSDSWEIARERAPSGRLKFRIGRSNLVPLMDSTTAALLLNTPLMP